MKTLFLLPIPLFAAVALLCAERRVSAADVSQATAVKPATDGDLPGKVIQSWLANSFSRQKGHHSVPVTAIAIAVTPNGTVFSAGVAEGYGGVASYKDGQFLTKYDYDSGFGSSASSVAVDVKIAIACNDPRSTPPCETDGNTSCAVRLRGARCHHTTKGPGLLFLRCGVCRAPGG